jgi:uncharacterized membrane protein
MIPYTTDFDVLEIFYNWVVFNLCYIIPNCTIVSIVETPLHCKNWEIIIVYFAVRPARQINKSILRPMKWMIPLQKLVNRLPFRAYLSVSYQCKCSREQSKIGPLQPMHKILG